MLANCLKNLPETPAVYIFRARGRPIYIGKAVNLKKRIASYFRLKLSPKTAQMVSRATRVSFIRVNSELEALLLEAKLIRKFQPKYNFIAKDDKHPLYIAITSDEFPRIISCRRLSAIRYKLVYGPFPSSAKVHATLKMLRKIIPFADHKLGKRACLYAQIGLCRPCPNLITTAEERKEYLTNIRLLKNILAGHIRRVRGKLQREMTGFSRLFNYEEASRVKNQIENLDYITQKSLPEEDFLANPNLATDLRTEELSGLKRVLIKNFKLKIKNCTRLECFDVSHLAGSFPTASMVTFINGEPEKSFYRRFRIRNSKGRSDTDSLKEVAQIRLKHLVDWGRPDLIIVDGGKAQATAFKIPGVPVVGIAKSHETLIAAGAEFRLPPGPAKNLIIRLRNESHRFAQKYHHLLVKKDLFSPQVRCYTVNG